ncbi:hypothetical protein C0J52_19885 [Blattella germanica]|nr:hypothetical protein C0J52_19885 [Blattella germanica]
MKFGLKISAVEPETMSSESAQFSTKDETLNITVSVPNRDVKTENNESTMPHSHFHAFQPYSRDNNVVRADVHQNNENVSLYKRVKAENDRGTAGLLTFYRPILDHRFHIKPEFLPIGGVPFPYPPLEYSRNRPNYAQTSLTPSSISTSGIIHPTTRPSAVPSVKAESTPSTSSPSSSVTQRFIAETLRNPPYLPINFYHPVPRIPTIPSHSPEVPRGCNVNAIPSTTPSNVIPSPQTENSMEDVVRKPNLMGKTERPFKQVSIASGISDNEERLYQEYRKSIQMTSEGRKRHRSQNGGKSSLSPEPLVAEDSSSEAKEAGKDGKGEEYWVKRRKNNEAAKRSRDARRRKEDELAIRVRYLQNRNKKLSVDIEILKRWIHEINLHHPGLNLQMPDVSSDLLFS